MGRTLSGESRGVNGFAQLLQQSHRKPQKSRLLARCSGVAPALLACCYDGVTMGLRWGYDGASMDLRRNSRVLPSKLTGTLSTGGRPRGVLMRSHSMKKLNCLGLPCPAGLLVCLSLC